MRHIRRHDPVDRLKAYQLIIRATWERGPLQSEALNELNRRGLWLSKEQRIQAGLEEA